MLEGGWDRECDSYKTSVWIVDRILEIDSGGVCTNLWYKMLLNCTLKMDKIANFELYVY